ncbi:MAG: alpha/beta fold hydrolase [Dehalococcoidia bacterium]|nr:alpha/beta fold hydrolase [Dehalococcoidia bacterium]
MQGIVRRLLPALLLAGLALASTLASACDGEGPQALREIESETFEMNGVTMRSRVVQVTTPAEDGEPYALTWHYVEAGEGEPVVFLHGLPESWYSWHYQLEALASEYRVIAIDLKGYGRSDKSDGDYRPANVADELLTLLDAIGLHRFSLVTHDWGTMIGDYLAGRHPDRVQRYVRMQAPLLKTDPKNHPQFVLFQDQALAARLMDDAEAFVRTVYEGRTVQPVAEEDMTRIIEEFSREGVAEAVPRYFRDFFSGGVNAEEREALFAAMDFPVLLLQADSDPAQPLWYFDGGTELFPDAELRVVRDCGHFSELEQPKGVTEAIRAFFEE